MAWFVPPIGLGQAAPDASGLVMIAQLTLPPGSFISGCSLGLTYHPAGAPGTTTVNNASPVLLPLTAGDVNRDLQVNVDDLLLVINSWGMTGQGIADTTDDGAVNVDDLLTVINHWGAGPGQCS